MYGGKDAGGVCVGWGYNGDGRDRCKWERDLNEGRRAEESQLSTAWRSGVSAFGAMLAFIQRLCFLSGYLRSLLCLDTIKFLFPLYIRIKARRITPDLDIVYSVNQHCHGLFVIFVKSRPYRRCSPSM